MFSAFSNVISLMDIYSVIKQRVLLHFFKRARTSRKQHQYTVTSGYEFLNC